MSPEMGPMTQLDENAPPCVHEKQILSLCAVHCTNNILQLTGSDRVTRSGFNSIAENLAPNAWINPHKSMFGLGNYDANVLIRAIQHKGFNVDWYDRRRRVNSETIPVDTDETIVGIICNRPTRSLMGLIKGAHWYSIRLLEGKYYNLDSYLSYPICLSSVGIVHKHLQDLLDSSPEANILLVRKPTQQVSNPGHDLALETTAAQNEEVAPTTSMVAKLDRFTQEIDD